MFIPGWLISLVTFPGVILHEWAHKKFCEWNGVQVKEVCYFRFGNPAGFVLHEIPKTFSQTFYISVGPLIVNSIFTILLGFGSRLFPSESSAYWLMIWLALSVGMHAFPSDHDASHVLKHSKSVLASGGTFLHYLSYPFFALIWIANKLRIFWFDAIYAIALVYLSGGLR